MWAIHSLYPWHTVHRMSCHLQQQSVRQEGWLPQQNLQNHLNYGSITQEEYNEYYPYDGMEGSYYSVFVETDLNKASTIDGQRLSSEDAIAEYIASMLLLETDPVFYISYDGVYTTGGTDYYEFRCHR